MRRRVVFSCALLLVVVAVVVSYHRAPLAPPLVKPAPAVVQPAITRSSVASRDAIAPPAGNETRNLVAEAARDLAAMPLSRRRARVEQLLRELDLLPPRPRSDAILNFLHTRVDVALPGEFLVGAGGWLRDWPTLRQALFDHLAQFDSTTARFVASEILTDPPADQPGAWALALRELARDHLAPDWPPLVAARMVDLLRNPTWARDAPRAYLEAFDVIVAGHATPLLPALSRLSATGSNATRFAAFVSADRLMLAAPAATLDELDRTPALFAGQPQIRAGLFARTDLRDAAQATALQHYLARADVAPAERATFAALFPLYDLTVSNNLLTSPGRRSIADMQTHDRLALAQMEKWRSDSSLSAWQEAFATISTRLQQQLSLTTSLP